MASTTEYLRQTSFADAQAANPSAPPSGPGLDGEFDRVKLAIDSTQQSLDLIQRDDGALANGIVKFESLSPGLLTGLEPAEVWAPATNYVVNNTVFVDNGTSIKLYRCVVSHTSASSFSVDLAAGRWSELVDYTPPTVVGVVPLTGGGTGATDATGARANLGLGPVAQRTIVPVSEGGTGADNAAAARVALGLEVGAQVQAYDATLAAFAGLSGSANQLPYFTGADAFALTTLSAFIRTLLDDANADAARATIAAAPRPVASAGVGQWVSIFADTNLALVLPAGGTWAYFGLIFDNTSSQVVANGIRVGVAAGGASVGGPVANARGFGFAWRVLP